VCTALRLTSFQYRSEADNSGSFRCGLTNAWHFGARVPLGPQAAPHRIKQAEVSLGAFDRVAVSGTAQLASTVQVAKSTIETLPGPPFTLWILCQPRFRYFGGATEPL
jgi:hypothetical protein